MPEQNIRYKIEDSAREHLAGDKQAKLLAFVEWLCANKMTPSWFRVAQYSQSKTWNVGFQGKKICVISVAYYGTYAGSWTISFAAYPQADVFIIRDNRHIKTSWDNVQLCRNCGSCKPGRRVVVGGKEFDKACISPLLFENPGEAELDCVKDLIQSICDPAQSAAHPATPDPAHIAKEQKNTKIEDYIPEQLENGMKTASCDFIVFLQANKMNPRFDMLNWWKVNYKGLICVIRLPYHHQKHMYSWAVGVCLDNLDKYPNEIAAGGLRNIVLDNMLHCKNCTPRCSPGKTVTVLGKEIKGICVNCSPTLTWIYDPDEAAIEQIKQLLTLEKLAR